jgi:hypothetical protein
MDPSNDYLSLVHDALYARHIKQVGCFSFNQASDRVQAAGPAILPTLERVLSDEVMPGCPSDLSAQHQHYPGLGNGWWTISASPATARWSEPSSSFHPCVGLR